MFVPFVPLVNNIVNKTVVYSDTVIPIQNMGSNIKVTVVEKVDEYEYEKAINLICSYNKDVLFHTIQYSMKNKKITFYTDIPIDLKKYEEEIEKSKIKKYSKPGNCSFINICENILRGTELNQKYSLMDLSLALNKYFEDGKRTIKRCESKIESMAHTMDDRLNVLSTSFEDNILEIHFYRDSVCECSFSIYIAKTSDGKYYLKETKDESYFVNANDLFNNCFNSIKELFDFDFSYNAAIKLVPKCIFLNSGICVRIFYTIEYLSIELASDEFFPKYCINYQNGKFENENLDYYSFEKIKNRESELFSKIEISDISIKDISFITDGSKTDNHPKKGFFKRFFS